MYAILSETKEIIASKKKQIEDKQNQINDQVHYQAKLLQEMNHLKGQVDMLENDLYRLEKQVQSDEQSKQMSSSNNCCMGPYSHRAL